MDYWLIFSELQADLGRIHWAMLFFFFHYFCVGLLYILPAIARNMNRCFCCPRLGCILATFHDGMTDGDGLLGILLPKLESRLNFFPC